MKLNDATPKIEVDPETYHVTADGDAFTCEPAERLPLAQRYFVVLTYAEKHRRRRRKVNEKDQPS